MDPSWQNLMLNDERLKDEALLGENGVEDGSSLLLLVSEPEGFYKLAEECVPIAARFLRVYWDAHNRREDKFCTEPSDPGMHVQFIAAGLRVIEADNMKANPHNLLHNIPVATGWCKSPTELKYGGQGLIGPWLRQMEIEFDFGAQVSIIGIQTDSPIPFTVSCSNDGEDWENLGTFPGSGVVQPARAWWRRKHGLVNW